MRLFALVTLVACGRIHFDESAANLCALRSVATGLGYTCALDDAGSAWCWGGNSGGEIALGGPRIELAATRVPLAMPALEVVPGYRFACARLVDESVWCWGNNTFGQLGMGVTGPPAGPVAVPIGDGALELGVGVAHACVRRASDQAIVCWGDNKAFRLGNRGAQIQAPTAIAGTAGTLRLAIGHRHNCAIDAQQRAVCWGADDAGQLGDLARTDRDTPMPTVIAAPVRGVTVAARSSCVADSAGAVHCWGGHPLVSGISDAPGTVEANQAIDIQAGPFGGCARSDDGTVSCWPNGVTLTGASSLSQIAYHACAMVAGKATCWGDNTEGALGRGTRSVSSTPVRVDLPGDADLIAAAGNTGCARVAGQLYCWGQSDSGQIGNGSLQTSTVAVPVDLSMLPSLDGVVGTVADFCAWGGGKAACWGLGTSGELGDGRVNGSPTPTAVTVVAGVSAMAAGAGYTCAVITGGNVRCWGRGDLGQLGNGTNTSSLGSVTVAFSGATTATAIAAGVWHTCAVVDSKVYCWGINPRGQLGNGTTTASNVPVLAIGTGTATSVTAGGDHSCAIVDGKVYCWGGLLAGAPSQMQTTPTLVDLPDVAVDVQVGFVSACARLASGATYCWGNGYNGELPTGAYEPSATPLEVPALAGATALDDAQSGGCAIVGGAVKCWGTTTLRAVVDDSNMPQPISVSCGPI